jgi:hypothetical protein
MARYGETSRSSGELAATQLALPILADCHVDGSFAATCHADSVFGTLDAIK